MFDYEADLDGGDLSFIFGDGAGSARLDLTNLPAQAKASEMFDLADFTGDLGVFDGLTSVRIIVNSRNIEALDFDLDNVKLVNGDVIIPEPSTLAIWGALGVIGLAYGARRRWFRASQ